MEPEEINVSENEEMELEEYEEYEEEEEEEEEEEDEEEPEEDEVPVIWIILVIMLIYSVTIVPLIYYYTPTGKRGIDVYYLTNKTALDWNEFQSSVESISSIPVTSETTLTFIIHGFSESSYRPWIHRLTQAILSRDKGNNIVLVIDYWDLHRPEYFWMRSNSHFVARYITRILDQLVLHNGLQLSRTHLIGFSLGGQICGMVGAKLKTGTLGRITALDPSFPYLDWKYAEESLDAEDAELVVILRTSAVSYYCPPGDVDIFVNGGVVQPGCDLWWYPLFVRQACSHFRPVMMVLEAERDSGKGAFPLCQCPDYYSFKNGSCSCNGTAYFDTTTFSSPKGTFYLDINENPPYTIRQDQID